MLGAVLAGMMMWSAATAPAAPPPLDAFFRKPAINGLRLSPSGRYLASIQKRGQGQAVVVLDRQTGQQSVATYAGSEHVGFDWIEWKSDDRLLLRTWLFEVLHANGKPDGPVTGFKYGRFVEAIDRDGKHLVVMFEKNPSAVQRTAPAFLAILDLLPSDPSHVLVAAPDARGFASVWKVDVGTGQGRLVEAGGPSTVGWGVDGAGQVVERTELVDGAMSFQARDPVSGWAEVARAAQPGPRQLADFEVLGPAPGQGQLYVAVRPSQPGEGDVRAVHVYDFNARSLGPALGPAARYDVSGIVYLQDSRQMAAACYVADVFTCEFRDPQMQARLRGLSRYFQDRRNLAPVSLSADGKLWVLSVTGADLPGAYYVLDADRKDIALLGERYPELPESALGKAERYRFKARDGTAIPAYLTRPPGAGPGALPTVVLVHDGPQARDSLDFDPLVQFLATRGYQVLQVNFRGSGGYGRTWADAGLRQWGGRMQDDLVDGVKALAAEGRADPARVCIMGGGYGGYAALQAAASRPELFRCAASWSGPSDLPALLRWERRNASRGYGEHLRSIGDPDADHDALAAASPVNHAGEFRASVLLVHGAQDDVVPAEQSDAMAEALKAAGKPVTLLRFEDEGHAEFSEAHMKAMFTAIEDLLARSLAAAASPAG